MGLRFAVASRECAHGAEIAPDQIKGVVVVGHLHFRSIGVIDASPAPDLVVKLMESVRETAMLVVVSLKALDYGVQRENRHQLAFFLVFQPEVIRE